MEEVPLDVWNEILESMPEMQFWVAQNKTVPALILDRLARSEDCKVRTMVAMKRTITGPISFLLAADSDETVRAALARNSKTPAKILESLRNDCSPLVREALEIHDRRSR